MNSFTAHSKPKIDATLPSSATRAQVSEDYNRERPHSSFGYDTPAAFEATMDKQWPASLRRTGSATQAVATTTHMRKKAIRL